MVLYTKETTVQFQKQYQKDDIEEKGHGHRTNIMSSVVGPTRSDGRPVGKTWQQLTDQDFLAPCLSQRR
jgi:hypothetical protein